MTEANPSQPRAFLSYSRRDAEAAEAILRALEARGVEVFRDTDDILPAEDWRGRLDGLIGAADAVVFLMSPNSVRSEVCSWEVHLSGVLNKRLVPVLLDEVDGGVTPPEVSRLNYIFATASHDFEDAVAKIAAAVQTDIGWMRDHTRLGERAREWDRTERPRAALLRGAELQRAEAWLAAQPAAAPSPTGVTREWLGASRAAATRRQRGWVAGSLAVAAVSIGLGVLAELNRRIAAEQRDRAERILDRSSKTANDLVFDMAQRFRDRSGVPQALVQDLLGRSRALLDQLAEAGEDRPDLLRSRAAALTEMSVTLSRQGDLETARDVAAEANAYFTALAGNGAPAARADLAAGLDREGDILLRLGDVDGAEARYRASHAVNRELAAENDAPVAWRLNLSVSEEKLGDIAAERGDAEGALTALTRALAIRDDVEARGRGAAILLEKQGDAQIGLEDYEAAKTAYAESLALTKAAADASPEDTRLRRDLSVIHQKLGDLVAALDSVEAALPHFEADAAIARRLNAEDPGREDWALDFVVSLDRLGVALFRTGHVEASLDLIENAAAIADDWARRAPSRDDLQAAATGAAQKLSLVAFAAGEYRRAAEAAARDASRLSAAGAEARYPDAINNVAWYRLFTDAPERALSAAREATALEPENAGYHLNLAHALLLSGDVEAASAIYAGDGSDDWRGMVEADFAAFDEAGIDHPPVDALIAAPE